MKSLLIICLLCSPYALEAQQESRIDSLRSKIKEGDFGNDSLKAQTFLDLVSAYYPINKDSAILYNQLAHDFARERGIIPLELRASINVGVFQTA